MNGGRCWGVYRELAHSPGRETDDAEILRAAARELEAKGFTVELKTPEDLADDDGEIPAHLFVMCERIPILEKLARWEAKGARVVNSVDGIRNTYRDRTISLFEKNAVSFPPSLVVPTGKAFTDERGAVSSASSYWVKRADVHSTQEGDVTFAADATAVDRALAAMAARGIGQAVVQQHVPGDLIKFYGVSTGGQRRERPAAWFQWFYHRGQTLAGHAFDRDALESAAAHAAATLGVDVYGGDAIATADGRTVIIDLNAWPSFALYRAEAARHIAVCLAARFLKEAEVPG